MKPPCGGYLANPTRGRGARCRTRSTRVRAEATGSRGSAVPTTLAKYVERDGNDPLTIAGKSRELRERGLSSLTTKSESRPDQLPSTSFARCFRGAVRMRVRDGG